MQEDDSTEEESPRPKKKIILVAVLLLGIGVLGGGWWLVDKKMGALSIDSEVEKAHREPSAHEKKAGHKKLAAGKFTDGELIPEAKEGDADLYSRPVLSGRDEVSVDQLAMVDMDTGEKRIKARLINHGHQKLTAAQVNIEFLNSSGQVVLSRAVNPLVVSGGIFGDQTEALAPGSSRPFYVLADDAPSGWSGKLGAKVMGFWFGSDDGEEMR